MKKRYTMIIISLVSVAIVFVSAAVALFVVSSRNLNAEPSATADSSPPLVTEEDMVTITEAPKASEENRAREETTTDSSSENPTDERNGGVTAPEEMNTILAQNGSTLQQLSDLGCSQLVTVSSAGSSAEIRFYHLENSTWIGDDSLTCSGFVGRNGVTSDMHEGGNASPRGLYHIGDAFYIYDRPKTGLNTFQVTGDTYWVDDPDSSHYNQHMEGTQNKDWNSAEHMIDYDVYRYGFVIDYNTAAEYNKGSAIFFHISSNPTAGCIGTDEAFVLGYLAKLNASANPYIIIV